MLNQEDIDTAKALSALQNANVEAYKALCPADIIMSPTTDSPQGQAIKAAAKAIETTAVVIESFAAGKKGQS